MIPCRDSVTGARAFSARAPKRADGLGNQGTGARTTLVASPPASRCRSRFSTKMPWFGRAACGNSVENVSRRSGVISRPEQIARRPAAGSRSVRQFVQHLSRLGLLLEVALGRDDQLQLLLRLLPVSGLLQSH